MTASDLPSQEGSALCCGTCDSTRNHLNKDARSGAARRQGPELRDTCRLWSPPLQESVVQNYNLRDSVWRHALLLIYLELVCGVTGPTTLPVTFTSEKSFHSDVSKTRLMEICRSGLEQWTPGFVIEMISEGHFGVCLCLSHKTFLACSDEFANTCI
jgi:hypothetical protein